MYSQDLQTCLQHLVDVVSLAIELSMKNIGQIDHKQPTKLCKELGSEYRIRTDVSWSAVNPKNLFFGVQ